jgi:hypothetical protein
MQFVVAMVAQRYHLTLGPGCRVDLDPGLTLRPRPGVPVYLHQEAESPALPNVRPGLVWR